MLVFVSAGMGAGLNERWGPRRATMDTRSSRPSATDLAAVCGVSSRSLSQSRRRKATSLVREGTLVRVSPQPLDQAACTCRYI